MIISLISISLTLSSMIFLILPVFLKRESISFGIKNGDICYRCKSDIESPISRWYIDPLTGEISFNEQMVETLCKSCERDTKLDSVLSIKKEIIIFGTKKAVRIQQITILCSVPFNVLSMIFRPLSIIGGLLLFIGMYLSYKNYLATTRKKVQS